MAEYRYLLYDLMTNTPITELPLTGVNFTRQLNSAGTFSASMLLTDAATDNLNVLQGTQPAKTALYVERSDLANGVGRSLVWGGIIWGREYGSNAQSISINAREMESFLEKVIVLPSAMVGKTTFIGAARFSNIDQFQIVNMLVQGMQFSEYTNIGLTVGGGLSGQLVTVDYDEFDFKTVYAALSDLSSAANGFDFNVDVYYDGNGTPQKSISLGYPQIGYRYSASDPNAPVLQLPGNILEYTYFEDGSLIENHIYATGSSPDVYAVADNATAVIPDGYPMYDGAHSYSDVTDVNLLQQIAQGRADANGYPPNTLKITAIASQAPTVGQVNPGDDVRISIRDARFPSGLNAVYRVTALTITPNESGGPEQITYALTQSGAVE